MTTVLQQVSDDLAATVEAVSPGLVRVEARRRLPASGLVWSPDGVIVTAHHVIEQDEASACGPAWWADGHSHTRWARCDHRSGRTTCSDHEPDTTCLG